MFNSYIWWLQTAAAASGSEQAPGGPGVVGLGSIQEPQLQVIGHIHSDVSDA